MLQMKPLARLVACLPQIYSDIKELIRVCFSCAKVSKTSMDAKTETLERLDLDHAGNFIDTNWLVLVNVSSKYMLSCNQFNLYKKTC